MEMEIIRYKPSQTTDEVSLQIRGICEDEDIKDDIKSLMVQIILITFFIEGVLEMLSNKGVFKRPYISNPARLLPPHNSDFDIKQKRI